MKKQRAIDYNNKMKVASSCIAVANEFITLSQEQKDKKTLTHLKLQKLVYIAYGIYLANYGKGDLLFYPEPEAWLYGPVISNLYYALGHLGNNEIKERIVETDIEEAEEKFIPIIKDETVKKAIKEVWIRYGALYAGTLIDITTSENTPWKKAADTLIDQQTEDEESYEKNNRHHRFLLTSFQPTIKVEWYIDYYFNFKL